MQNSTRERLIPIVLDSLMKHIDKSCNLAENIVDDLIANGVILPSCKVGDCIYAKSTLTNEFEYWIVGAVTHLGSDSFEYVAILEDEDGYEKETIEFMNMDIGTTVFFTKEEAEQKLKEHGDK